MRLPTPPAAALLALLALPLLGGCRETPAPVDLTMRPIEPAAGDAAAVDAGAPEEEAAAEPTPAAAPAALSDEEVARLRKVGAVPFDGTDGGATDPGAADPTAELLGNWKVVATAPAGLHTGPVASRIRFALEGAVLHFGATYYTVEHGGDSVRVNYRVLGATEGRIHVELRTRDAAGDAKPTGAVFVVEDGEKLKLLDEAGNVTLRAERI